MTTRVLRGFAGSRRSYQRSHENRHRETFLSFVDDILPCCLDTPDEWRSLSSHRSQGGNDLTVDPELETVVSLLDDEHARTILVETCETPLSASELADRCEASRQTVYRRLERLEAAGLIAERTRPREDGHHDAVYTAILDRVSIELREGALEFELERNRSDPVDELTKLWRNF